MQHFEKLFRFIERSTGGEGAGGGAAVKLRLVLRYQVLMI